MTWRFCWLQEKSVSSKSLFKDGGKAQSAPNWTSTKGGSTISFCRPVAVPATGSVQCCGLVMAFADSDGSKRGKRNKAHKSLHGSSNLCKAERFQMHQTPAGQKALLPSALSALKANSFFLTSNGATCKHVKYVIR